MHLVDKILDIDNKSNQEGFPFDFIIFFFYRFSTMVFFIVIIPLQWFRLIFCSLSMSKQPLRIPHTHCCRNRSNREVLIFIIPSKVVRNTG